MYGMSLGSLKHLFLSNTARKLMTLGVTTSMLVAMVSLDASASSFSGRNSSSLSTATLIKLAKETANREHSGVVRRHRPLQTGTTTTTAPVAAGGGGGASATSTSTSTSTSTTTSSPTTTTTAAPSAPTAAGGPIIAGPSRSECLEPDTPNGGFSSLASLQSTVSSFNQETHSNVTCLLAYLNGTQTWAQWEDPWIAGAPGTPFTSWVAEAPQTRQLVLQVDLIPTNLANINNPLAWEQSCAAGDFDSYATQLGDNLVAAGLQSSVIRLGPEMNGNWENDSMGNTTQEQNLWATCFANEVTGLRQAAGEHFLIDWNPNACTQSVPYSNFYPGNAYVDIIGLDFYDVSCETPSTVLTFAQLNNEAYGLASIQAFATAQGKPMSLPEWGLATGPEGDDPGYIEGVGAAVANNDYAFEAYFDAGTGIGVILGPGTPLSLTAFQKVFGSS
jgi:hypothetical protein